MDEFENNTKLFKECVSRWEEQDEDKNRNLFVKDLNIARTLLLWIYPPFLEEYEDSMSKPLETSVKAGEFPGFGNDKGETEIRWNKQKELLRRWKIRVDLKRDMAFTELKNALYPKPLSREKHGNIFLPYSDLPSPARVISYGSDLHLNRYDGSAPVMPFEIAITLDTRWNTNDILKEVSKIVKDFQSFQKDNNENLFSKIDDDEILKSLQENLHPRSKVCPQGDYYDFFYQFVIENKGYQEIAEFNDLNGDQARGRVKKAINWVVEFLDYDTQRGFEWAKQHIKKS